SLAHHCLCPCSATEPVREPRRARGVGSPGVVQPHVRGTGSFEGGAIMSAGAVPLGPRLDRVQNLGMLIGGVALLVCLVLGLIWPSVVLPPYLVGFIFWFGIALGCLGLNLLNILVGAGWGQ